MGKRKESKGKQRADSGKRKAGSDVGSPSKEKKKRRDKKLDTNNEPTMSHALVGQPTFSAKGKGKSFKAHSPEFSDDLVEPEKVDENGASMSSRIMRPIPRKAADVDMDTRKDDESEDEDEAMDAEYVGLEMDRVTEYGPTITNDIITEFTNPPTLYFKDHTAPFRGLMSEMRAEETSVKNDSISKLFRVNTSKKVLVAVSGKS
jgi:hypothetical protein